MFKRGYLFIQKCTVVKKCKICKTVKKHTKMEISWFSKNHKKIKELTYMEDVYSNINSKTGTVFK